MKLRSIALAGLLGAGLMMTSGCSSDEVKDAIEDIEDIAKPNAVYVVNGYQGGILVHVDDEEKNLYIKEIGVFALMGGETTDVSYTLDGNQFSETTSFPYGSAYLYVPTDQCNLVNGFGTMTDKSTGTGVVELVNATSSDVTYSTSTVVVHVNNATSSADYIIALKEGDTIPACSKAATTTTIKGLGIQTGDNVSVTIGGTTSNAYNITGKVPETVDFDIVLLGGEDAVAIPLIQSEDIIIQSN